MPPTSAEPSLTAAEKAAFAKLALRWDYQPLEAVSTAFTAGSSLSFTAANFTAAHFEQKDLSLNKTLWGLWPTSGTSLDEYIKTNQKEADRHFKPLREYWPERDEPPFDLVKLQTALPFAERARLASSLRLINELHVRAHETGLLPANTLNHGLNPLSLLDSRKRRLHVVPLSKAIESGKKLKARADAAFASVSHEIDEKTAAQKLASHKTTIQALGDYCSALLGLWPWTASGLIMSPQVAFESGIAQLEAVLWRNIATTLMMLHGYSGRNKEGDGMYFAVLARLCNLVPLLTRYVPLGEFWQAYSGMMLHAMTVPPLGYGYEMALGMDGMAFMALYNGGDTWAHEQCDTTHTMCRSGDVDRSHLRRSPEEYKTISPKSEERKAKAEKAKEESEAGSNKSEKAQRNYYNRRGEVVATGPDIPMRLTGLVGPSHQLSKPSAKYPCD